MFYGHPNCKVAWSKNAVVEREGIVEIPITGLYKYRPMRAGLFGIAHERFFAKTDLDSCSLNELLLYVEAAKERNVSVMNLFMHSYSLLAFDGKFRCFKPDRSDDEKLRGFLATAANTGNVRFMSVAGFWEQYQRDPSGFHGSDSVPESPERTGTVRFFFGKAKDRVARLIDRIA